MTSTFNLLKVDSNLLVTSEKVTVLDIKCQVIKGDQKTFVLKYDMQFKTLHFFNKLSLLYDCR